MQSVSTTIDHLQILRNHPILGELPNPTIQRLLGYATTRKVRRGTTIFAKGDAGTQLIAVLSGRVKIIVSSLEGREAVLNVVQEGEVFGEIALFDGRPRTAGAIAISDCELLSIDRRHLLPLVREQPDIAIKLIATLCARLRRSSEQYEDIMFLNRPARVAKLLLRLAEEAKGPPPRKVLVTQQEMSQMAGMSRESVNKQLRFWAQAKWVRLERGEVAVLRPDALADLVAEPSGARPLPLAARPRR
ncbi:MAG TPA: Crp/Fnr family transcriptional regulator [Hyphomicrobiaceae bacterium]|nr:Crp/Fnr family transcriptional regulator [Hyphomicrobiaceae bacterium]